MPVSTDDDWSDSDEEVGEMDVLLGVPDGMVETESDIKDAAVSRIGGLPAFLPSREPSFSSSQCKVCSDPMELLVQVWCPFEDSPMDRALYVWGCARSSCQRETGSIRAWRGLRYNTLYATKLEQKKKMAQSAARPQASTKNPFSVSCHASAHQSVSQIKIAASPTAFGLGDQIFGNTATDIPGQLKQDREDAESDNSSSSEDSLVTAMASTRMADSFWDAAPSYPAIYLSTLSEYIPQPPKAKIPEEDSVGMTGKDKDSTWALETYENSLKIDNVFEKFTKRVGFTGEQCLRYDLKGIPLPFASDKIFELLFPVAAQALLPVTKSSFKVVPPTKRSYSTASIPPCPCCKSSRVFECQLMPNLINVLRASDSSQQPDVQKLTDKQRIKAVQDALKRSKEAGDRGMEWGVCMVFSCGSDCCMDDDGKEDKECWREEYVLVQWDE